LRRRADELRTVEERIEFVDREMPLPVLMFVFDQVPPVLAGLAALAVAERLVARWLGRPYGVEPVRRWLPHDPTAAMGLDLWRLASRLAQRDEQPSVAEPGVAEFLARYGHRAADHEIDVGAPRFADDPTYVLGLLRTYIGTLAERRDADDALRRFEEGVARARRTSAESVAATSRVKGPAHAAVLRVLLDRGRALAGLREQPKFDLVRAVALARHVLRQVGEALAADGVLAAAEDIFFLDPADVRTALREGTASRLRERVADNRREFELARARSAVPRILTSEGEAVYGPAAAPGSDTLVGTPVSPGVHEGVVRVVASPVNAGLQPGEVLVAATTDPGWTPLFLTAGALVMEVGGVVSHGALVAREYGLPAVTAVVDATTLLETGQRVRVDGAAGTVTVLSEA
ncbi:MAG: PEP-utilizing enzyme, partial [Mycobacterium leprae]